MPLAEGQGHSRASSLPPAWTGFVGAPSGASAPDRRIKKHSRASPLPQKSGLLWERLQARMPLADAREHSRASPLPQANSLPLVSRRQTGIFREANPKIPDIPAPMRSATSRHDPGKLVRSPLTTSAPWPAFAAKRNLSRDFHDISPATPVLRLRCIMFGEPNSRQNVELAACSPARLGVDARSLARTDRAPKGRILVAQRFACQSGGHAPVEPGALSQWIAVGTRLSRSFAASRRLHDGLRALHRAESRSCRTGPSLRRLSVLGCDLVAVMTKALAGKPAPTEKWGCCGSAFRRECFWPEGAFASELAPTGKRALLWERL